MENPPLLSELPATKYFQLPKQNFSCIACKKNAKYQCPKCKSYYCDLICYKNHNPECAEEFYKEQVTQHLKGKKVSEAEIKKMKRILEKYKDKDVEDEPCTEIEESLLKKKVARLNELKDILEKGELTLEKLSPEEQVEFGKFIDMQKTKWKPWKPYWWREEVYFNVKRDPFI